jgi:hypothetical protein
MTLYELLNRGEDVKLAKLSIGDFSSTDCDKPTRNGSRRKDRLSQRNQGLLV